MKDYDYVTENERILEKWKRRNAEYGETNFADDGIMYRGKIEQIENVDEDALNIKFSFNNADKETILIVETDDKVIGLVVDKLLGDQDILQKKLLI